MEIPFSVSIGVMPSSIKTSFSPIKSVTGVSGSPWAELKAGEYWVRGIHITNVGDLNENYI